MARKRNQTVLDPEMVEIFIKGHSFESLLDWYPGSPFQDENHKRQTWKQYRDYILKTYRDRTPTPGDENTYPSGSRPWAFYQYDLKIERPENELEFLKKNELLFTDELFQYNVNQQTQKLKHGFRISDKPELRTV